MSRAERIGRWLEEARATRHRVEVGREDRARTQRSWLDDEVRGRSTPRSERAELRFAKSAIETATITGGRDEERQRVRQALPASLGGGSGGQGSSGPRPGGSSSGSIEGDAGSASRMSSGGGSGSTGSAVGRARQLAAGYQPAVVKVVSYARGTARVTATAQYVQRDEVTLETHDGRLLRDREMVADEVKAWSTDFARRAESQDVAAVRVRLDGVRDTPEGRATYAAALEAGFAGHRHAWRLEARPTGELEGRLVVALAGSAKERFRVREERVGEGEAAFVRRRFDNRSEATLIERIATATGLAAGAIRLDPGAPAHARDGVTQRLDRLVAGGPATDDRGRPVADVAAVRSVVREWGPSLRSQSSRDTMHLILSAKAGINPAALARVARAFLDDRFADHKFMFGVHTDKAEDGHIHAHAVIAVRSESGRKIHPGPETFRDWREAYAEHAQVQGLKIVATGARERASSQSYGPKDKAIVAVAERPRSGREARDRAYAADPANQQLIDGARQRIRVALANPIRLPVTDRGRQAIGESVAAWSSVAREAPENLVARAMVERLTLAQAVGGILQTIGKRVGFLTEDAAMAVTADKMAKDLHLMNEAVSRTSDLLEGETRRQFQERSAAYLETLAVRVDLQRLQESGVEQLSRAEVERIAGVNADRLIERANEIRLKEEREAAAALRQAEQTVEADRRIDAGAARGPEAQDERRTERMATDRSEQAAAREAREAAATTETARLLAEHPGQPIPQALVQTDALAKLQLEQEKVLRELEAEKSEAEAIKPQRQR